MLFIHLLTVIARLLGPDGTKSVLAEDLLLKHELLIFNRSRGRGLHLHTFDRVLLGLFGQDAKTPRMRDPSSSQRNVLVAGIGRAQEVSQLVMSKAKGGGGGEALEA